MRPNNVYVWLHPGEDYFGSMEHLDNPICRYLEDKYPACDEGEGRWVLSMHSVSHPKWGVYMLGEAAQEYMRRLSSDVKSLEECARIMEGVSRVHYLFRVETYDDADSVEVVGTW